MRTTFIDTLMELAEKDDRIWLLTGDVGYSVLEGFEAKFPDRFLNCGIAEQNMMGVAAGMALCGKQPWVYSLAGFPVTRCLEQIRNDVCHHNLDVKMISAGAWEQLGNSHRIINDEDRIVLGTLENMTQFFPRTADETRQMALEMASRPSPCYIRLSRLK